MVKFRVLQNLIAQLILLAAKNRLQSFFSVFGAFLSGRYAQKNNIIIFRQFGARYTHYRNIWAMQTRTLYVQLLNILLVVYPPAIWRFSSKSVKRTGNKCIKGN